MKRVICLLIFYTNRDEAAAVWRDDTLWVISWRRGYLLAERKRMMFRWILKAALARQGIHDLPPEFSQFKLITIENSSPLFLILRKSVKCPFFVFRKFLKIQASIPADRGLIVAKAAEDISRCRKSMSKTIFIVEDERNVKHLYKSDFHADAK